MIYHNRANYLYFKKVVKLMPYNVIVGRNESDKKRLGERGTIFIGKNYVKMGPTTSLSNNILLDVASSHIVLVSGKRGSGKSFSLSAIAEEMVKLPEEVSKNLAVRSFFAKKNTPPCNCNGS